MSARAAPNGARRAPPRSKPYAVLAVVERRIGLPPNLGTFKQRSYRVWRWCCDFWETPRTLIEIDCQLSLIRELLKMTCASIFAPVYKTCSTARWLCALKTHLRIAGGVCFALGQHHRHTTQVIMRTAPVGLHTAAAVVEEEGGWTGSAVELLRAYFDMAERAEYHEVQGRKVVH